jgi:hypothetical protein
MIDTVFAKKHVRIWQKLAKFPTFPTLFDEVYQISITKIELLGTLIELSVNAISIVDFHDLNR